MKLVLATRNHGKIREMAEILAPLNIEVLSMDAFPDFPEVEEDGETFLENAVKKARVTAQATGEIALADDSGLEVDCLDGRPGVHSARFAGEPKDDRANNEKLLSLMVDVPPERRTARFRCAIAVATPGGEVHTTDGTCEGVIIGEPRGGGGFGYDPLFYLRQYGKTFAELDLATKNKISHRGRALAGVLDILAELSSRRS